MSARKRAVVVFPGRGSYGAAELGYLAKRQGQAELIAQLDAVVTGRGGTSIRELDASEKFLPSRHLPGRNASNLIYAAAQADFAAIDRAQYDVVAVCGNSLGWYLTLAAAGAVSLSDGARIVDTMGDMMEREGIGGQVLYPLFDRDWQADAGLAADVAKALEEANRAGRAFVSIRLGGIAVLAGDDPAVTTLMKALPPLGDTFPLRLPRHAAFHTPLLADISARALAELSPSLFGQPRIPMIDGRGAIWTPHACDLSALHDYTFGAQIVETYDFGKSVEVALKEFAPDCLILSGPGTSMLTPVGQTIARLNWRGVGSKADFEARQKNQDSSGQGRILRLD